MATTTALSAAKKKTALARVERKIGKAATALGKAWAKHSLPRIAEFGLALIEGRELLDHGEVGGWFRHLEEETDFTERTLQNFMHCAENLGLTTKSTRQEVEDKCEAAIADGETRSSLYARKITAPAKKKRARRRVPIDPVLAANGLAAPISQQLSLCFGSKDVDVFASLPLTDKEAKRGQVSLERLESDLEEALRLIREARDDRAA